jgi:DNA-binding transcriptional MocR family regulator
MALADAEAFARRAVENGLRVTPPSSIVLGKDYAGVRLCIQTPSDRASLERGLHIVKRLISQPEDPVV